MTFSLKYELATPFPLSSSKYVQQSKNKHVITHSSHIYTDQNLYMWQICYPFCQFLSQLQNVHSPQLLLLARHIYRLVDRKTGTPACKPSHCSLCFQMVQSSGSTRRLEPESLQLRRASPYVPLCASCKCISSACSDEVGAL